MICGIPARFKQDIIMAQSVRRGCALLCVHSEWLCTNQKEEKREKKKEANRTEEVISIWLIQLGKWHFRHNGHPLNFLFTTFFLPHFSFLRARKFVGTVCSWRSGFYRVEMFCCAFEFNTIQLTAADDKKKSWRAVGSVNIKMLSQICGIRESNGEMRGNGNVKCFEIHKKEKPLLSPFVRGYHQHVVNKSEPTTKWDAIEQH